MITHTRWHAIGLRAPGDQRVFWSLTGRNFTQHPNSGRGNGDYCSTHFPLNVKPEPPTPQDWPLAFTFRSDHPGGVNFTMCDGSVAFLNDGIDYDAFRYMSTRNEGEIIENSL